MSKSKSCITVSFSAIQIHTIFNDYVDEFQRLNARNNLNEDSSYELLRFISSLKDSLKDKLDCIAQLTLAEVISITTKFEAQIARTTYEIIYY